MQANVLHGTGAAEPPGLDPRRVTAAHVGVHLSDGGTGGTPQRRVDRNRLPPPHLAVIEITAVNPAAEHLLQAHRLQAELQFVRLSRGVGSTALVLHRHRQPQPVIVPQAHAVRPATELHDITFAADAEHCGKYTQPAHGQQIAAFLGKPGVMRLLVKDRTADRARILRPLPLDVNQCPLATAERKVLDAADLQIILLGVCHYAMRVTVTPAGTAASSTLTL